MKITNDSINKSIYALEASRRAGWAKYFERDEQVETLRNLIFELTDMIIFHDRIPTSDPILKRVPEIRSQI